VKTYARSLLKTLNAKVKRGRFTQLGGGGTISGLTGIGQKIGKKKI